MCARCSELTSVCGRCAQGVFRAHLRVRKVCSKLTSVCARSVQSSPQCAQGVFRAHLSVRKVCSELLLEYVEVVGSSHSYNVLRRVPGSVKDLLTKVEAVYVNFILLSLTAAPTDLQ